VALPAGRHDYISCLASIHYMPFATVATLREALAPGGVLVILGCYRQRTAADYAVVLAATPVNAAARLTVAALLPGCVVRRRLFWRYLLVFRRPPEP